MKMKNVEDLYPLSPMQQAMLAHALYAPASRVSFEQSCELLRGNLDLQAFMRAWQQVMKRHAVLRTGIISRIVDEPLQVVRQQVALPLRQYDWRDQSETEQEVCLKELLQADQERGFELEKAPLTRMHLIRRAEEEYYFIWSFHHIILDGWSKDIVMSDFLAHYIAYAHNREIQVAPNRPYQEYIAWLQQQDFAKAEEAWRRELQGFSAPTRLPLARSSSVRYTEEEASEEREVRCSGATTAALKILAQKSLVTLNVLLQGAWSLLLHRYSGADDIVFGATVSGRPLSLAGAESMVGLFINILPVRVHVSADLSLQRWMQEIQNRQLEMDQFSYSPLMHIQEWSDVPWSQPLFESLLVFENYPTERASSGEQIVPFERQNVYGASRTNHALTVIIEPGEELALHVSYDRHSFDLSAVEQVTAYLSDVLEKLSACVETDRVDTLFITGDAGDVVVPEPAAEQERCAEQGEMSHAGARLEAPYVAPRTPLEFQLVRMWEEILGVHPIGITDNFFALGGHSLSALRLAAQIRGKLCRGFPISLLAHLGTVQNLAQMLQQQGASEELQSPIVALQEGSGTPFFCVHPGSGNILCYRHLVRHLDPSQPFYAIHDLDIHKDVFPEVPIEKMAARYIEAIREIQPHGPYALGGFSFGGIVAFEMAHQLTALGEEVRLLALLDSGSPLSTQGFENEDTAGFLSVITMEAIRTSSSKTAEDVYLDLRALPLDEQLRYVVEQMMQAGFDPPANGPLGIGHELEIYRTRTRMIQRYDARMYPGSLTLFQAQEHDGLAPETSLREAWQKFAAMPIEVYPVPGFHDTLLDDPQVQVLAEKLQALLEEASSTNPARAL